jgi:hypothetical protein
MATSQPEAGGAQLLSSPVFSLLSTESAEAHIRVVFGDSYYTKGQLEEFRAIDVDFADEVPTVGIVSDGSSDDEEQGSSKRQKLEEAGKPVHGNLNPSAQATSSGITASQAAAVAATCFKEPATAVNPGLPALQMCNHPGNQNNQHNGSHFHITGKNAKVYVNDPEMKEATI